MARPRQGIGFVQRGVVYTGIRTRDRKRVTWPVLETDPPPQGVPLAPAWAKAVSLARQAAYAAGTWQPGPPPAPSPASPAPAPRTTLEIARSWVKTLPKAQAIDDGRRIEYLARAPLGARPAAAVVHDDLHAFVAWLIEQPSQRGGTLAPRTVRNVHDALRRMFAWAASKSVALVPSNPCATPPDNLPALEDKHAEFRAGAVFTRAEAVALCTDPRVPPDRRVLYALLLLTGCRFGEVAALRWRHWSADLAPLGRLLIALSVERATRAEKRTKTGVTREVPVHPTLAALLAAWQRDGWREMLGRAPTADDYLIPSREGRARSVRLAHARLQEDLGRLGLRNRRVHDARRTFVSLCRDDGARGEILRHVTHGARRRDMLDVYSTLGWATYCAEVARLRFDLTAPVPPPAEGFVTGFVTTDPRAAGGETKNAAGPATYGVLKERGGRDSNPARRHQVSQSATNSPVPPAPTRPDEAPDGRFVTGFVTDVTDPEEWAEGQASAEASWLAALGARPPGWGPRARNGGDDGAN